MAVATSTLWDEILGRLRTDAPHLFRAWFYDLRLAELDRGTLVIEVHNESQEGFLKRSCRPAILRAAQSATQRLVSVEYRLGKPQEPSPVEIAPPAAEHTFDGFVVGPENKIAYTAAVAVAQDPGAGYNPLVIVGPPGTGKTHLLGAIERAARIAGLRARYWTASSFTAAFVKSLEDGFPEAFRAEVGSLDFLLIDDLDTLAWKERTLEELFHLHQTMTGEGRQLVFSSKLPLDRADGLGPRLTSRLRAGLVVTLEPPSFETRCLLLTARAKAEGADVPEQVTHHLARTFEDNVTELLDGLRKVVAAAHSKGVAIDVPLTQQALAHERPSASIGRVVEAVSARFEVPIERLAGGRPARKQLVARDAAVYLSQRLTPATVDEIAAAFGGLAPVQVVEIGRRIERERDADHAFAAVLDEIAEEAKNAS